MAVFTALRNKAQSGLAGLVTGATKSALGLNRAAGLRFPDVRVAVPAVILEICISIHQTLGLWVIVISFHSL